MIPYKHLLGQECPKCSNLKRGKRLTKEEFIEKASKVHNNKYDYSLVKYVNNKTEVWILCSIKDHPPFEKRPDNHLYNKEGCPLCGNISKGISKLKGLEFFINKSKEYYKDDQGNPLYDYSKAEYKGYHKPFTVICSKHGEFYPTIGNHSNGKAGCTHCRNNRYSQPERDIIDILKQSGYNPLHNKYMFRKFADIVLEEYKLIIEYNGGIWHHSGAITSNSFVKKQIKPETFHQERYFFFKEKGYDLFYIFDFESVEDKINDLFLYLKDTNRYIITFDNIKREHYYTSSKYTLTFYGESKVILNENFVSNSN